MEGSEITIYIGAGRFNPGNGTGARGGGSGAFSRMPNGIKTLSQLAVTQIGGAVVNASLQMANNYVSHIGDLTGNMQRQYDVQWAIKVASASLNTLTGLVSAGLVNPVIGAVATASTAITMGVSWGLEIWNNNLNNAKENIAVSINRRRAGLDASYGNGCMTEN